MASFFDFLSIKNRFVLFHQQIAWKEESIVSANTAKKIS